MKTIPSDFSKARLTNSDGERTPLGPFVTTNSNGRRVITGDAGSAVVGVNDSIAVLQLISLPQLGDYDIGLILQLSPDDIDGLIERLAAVAARLRAEADALAAAAIDRARSGGAGA